jgi:hypothetical protein
MVLPYVLTGNHVLGSWRFCNSDPLVQGMKSCCAHAFGGNNNISTPGATIGMVQTPALQHTGVTHYLDHEARHGHIC